MEQLFWVILVFVSPVDPKFRDTVSMGAFTLQECVETRDFYEKFYNDQGQEVLAAWCEEDK